MRLHWATAAVLSALASYAYGGAKTDGTAGAVQPFSGNFTIPQTLGTIRGANLFHSFQNFSVDSGESATFTTTSAFSNVISRVTGGGVSTINGLLKLAPAAGSKPNFFFINPAGVVFGAGATIDVPAGFHVSTADYLKFPDGQFYADTSRTSTFSAADPTAFGFLGATRASIVAQDGALITAKAGQPISLIAGDIQIDNATVRTQGGDITAVANGNVEQEINRSGDLPYTLGDFNIVNGARISASSNGTLNGGTIAVSAGNMVIDGQFSDKSTGIFSNANFSSSGNAGNIDIKVYQQLSILNGAQISSSTDSIGSAGVVKIDAGSVNIDGQGATTGIFSIADSDSSGGAGTINLSAVGDLNITNGGQVSSSTYAAGDAGAVTVKANNIYIDGTQGLSGIFSNAESGSTGGAGTVDVTATNTLAMLGNAEIVSSTFGAGSARTVNVTAGNIVIDGNGDNSALNGIGSQAEDGSSGNAGTVTVTAKGQLSILNGASISSTTFADGEAGTVNINAAKLVIDGQGLATGIYTNSNGPGNGPAGEVDVNVSGALEMRNGGQIASNTYTVGNAGIINVKAGSILLDDQLSGSSTGIFTIAKSGSEGDAGSLNISTSGNLSILNGAKISSTTESSGFGGIVNVDADSITIDGGGRNTGIFSDTKSTGPALFVGVVANGNISILNGGRISSSTTSDGDAGKVSVQADSITIDGGTGGVTTGILSETKGKGNASPFIDDEESLSVAVKTAGKLSIVNGGEISSNAYSEGSAGIINIDAGSIKIDKGVSTRDTGIFSASVGGKGDPDKAGSAGTINISVANDLTITNGGQISTSTSTVGDAGAIYINSDAANITIDGKGNTTGIFSNINPGSTGSPGSIGISTQGNVSILAGGAISSSTFGGSPDVRSDAGDVAITAGSLTIDGKGATAPTGIFTDAVTGSYGNSGTITLDVAGKLSILNGGQVASNSFSPAGYANQITINAGEIELDGGASIISAAMSGSSGETGIVEISADKSISLSNGSRISIQNSATVDQPDDVRLWYMSVSAPTIALHDSQMSARSDGNVGASDIRINYTDRMTVDPSSITTSAVTGNGGMITIEGSGPLTLDHSQITTSVLGTTNGNGGNISISAPVLVLNTGFIQANTRATAASGGDVTIKVDSTVSSGNTLFVGGSPLLFNPDRFAYNVIQAAAPTGVSGNIQITSPQVDLTGSLSSLVAQVLDSTNLVADLCRTGEGSSLTLLGHGGLPANSAGYIRPR
jgi:filamentous hemagglutinin family protein